MSQVTVNSCVETVDGAEMVEIPGDQQPLILPPRNREVSGPHQHDNVEETRETVVETVQNVQTTRRSTRITKAEKERLIDEKKGSF